MRAAELVNSAFRVLAVPSPPSQLHRLTGRAIRNSSSPPLRSLSPITLSAPYMAASGPATLASSRQLSGDLACRPATVEQGVDRAKAGADGSGTGPTGGRPVSCAGPHQRALPAEDPFRWVGMVRVQEGAPPGGRGRLTNVLILKPAHPAAARLAAECDWPCTQARRGRLPRTRRCARRTQPRPPAGGNGCGRDRPRGLRAPRGLERPTGPAGPAARAVPHAGRDELVDAL